MSSVSFLIICMWKSSKDDVVVVLTIFYKIMTVIQGGPERMQHLQTIISKKWGTKTKRWKHYGVNYFPSKMTPRLLSLIKAFWFYGRFSEAITFWRFDLSQKWQIKFAIIWLPSEKCLLLLCKAKQASIQKSIHYVTWKHNKHSLRNLEA